MPDEFSYTFRRHSIVLTRDSEDRNWYIRVRAPNGLHVYDGYWRDSAGKTLKEALAEAKHGAQLKPYAARGVGEPRGPSEPTDAEVDAALIAHGLLVVPQSRADMRKALTGFLNGRNAGAKGPSRD